MTDNETKPDEKPGAKGADASNPLLCGCGRPVRYMIKGTEGACNKYMRCLTREELENALSHANSLLMAYRMKRSVDGLNGRTWDAGEHYKAEAIIEKLEST